MKLFTAFSQGISPISYENDIILTILISLNLLSNKVENLIWFSYENEIFLTILIWEREFPCRSDVFSFSRENIEICKFSNEKNCWGFLAFLFLFTTLAQIVEQCFKKSLQHLIHHRLLLTITPRSSFIEVPSHVSFMETVSNLYSEPERGKKRSYVVLHYAQTMPFQFPLSHRFFLSSLVSVDPHHQTNKHEVVSLCALVTFHHDDEQQQQQH